MHLHLHNPEKIFDDNSDAAWHARVGEMWDGNEANGIAVAVKSGNTHVQLGADEWSAFEEVTAPVVDRWIAEMSDRGIDGQAIYDQAVKLIGENAATQ